MDFSNTLASWLLSQLEVMPIERLRDYGLADSARLLDHFLGEREAQEVRVLLERPSASGERVSTVFLPGIMGSLLSSIRGISALLWFNPTVVLNGHINLLDLDDEGTGDRSPDVEIVPTGVEKLSYLKLILTLARETRLYEFPYDWRRHIEHNARILRDAIHRWCAASPARRFTLIGHSMGGMVIRTYLALYPAEAEQHVERVILIGSPLQGVAVAPLIYSGDTPNQQIVGRLHPDNDVLRFTRNLPSCYQLLPPPPELWSSARDYPLSWDPYNAAEWHTTGLRQDYLDDARHWHKITARADPQCEIVQLAGCNKPTITDVWVPKAQEDPSGDKPSFTYARQESGPDSGDDTVPIWSVQGKGITTYFIEERHQNLCANQLAVDAVMAVVNGKVPALARQVPARTALLERIKSASVLQQVAELRRRFDSGELRREDLQKLFFVK